MWLQRSVRRLSSLRVPSGAVCGEPADVPRILPLLHELSDGAKRGTPRWVEQSDSLGAMAPRKRSASWLEITYPFSTDEELRAGYMLADGESLRAGRFLEELDAFSADVSKRHASSEERPVTVVTAAHDGLSVFNSLSAVHDFRLRGAVFTVGSSSMEVRTDILQVEPSGEEVLLGSCYTMMVARDAGTFGKATVPPLRGGDAESAKQEAEAALRKQRRKVLRDEALSIKPPTPTEVPLLHELHRQGVHREAARAHTTAEDPTATVVPMDASELRALELMQPINRNMNGFIFGGYLLRRAFEAAWLSAHKHGRRRMLFGGVDDMTFSKPVEVGKIVELTARVAFVDPGGSTLRVFVDVDHVSLSTGLREPTCEFHFVFHTPPSTLAPQVQPITYAQTLLWLEGRRRWLATCQGAEEDALQHRAGTPSHV